MNYLVAEKRRTLFLKLLLLVTYTLKWDSFTIIFEIPLIVERVAFHLLFLFYVEKTIIYGFNNKTKQLLKIKLLLTNSVWTRRLSTVSINESLRITNIAMLRMTLHDQSQHRARLSISSQYCQSLGDLCSKQYFNTS